MWTDIKVEQPELNKVVLLCSPSLSLMTGCLVSITKTRLVWPAGRSPAKLETYNETVVSIHTSCDSCKRISLDKISHWAYLPAPP